MMWNSICLKPIITLAGYFEFMCHFACLVFSFIELEFEFVVT